MPQKYSHCIDCGEPKNKPNYNPRCRSCSKRTLPVYTECVDCGKPKTTKAQRRSERCAECAPKQRGPTKHTHYEHCVDCGEPKARNIYPRCKSCSKKKLWQDSEYQEKQAAYREDPEFIRKQRESHIKIWADPEKRERQRQTQKEVWADPELKERHSETLSEAYAQKYADPEEYGAIRALLVEYTKENWRDPDYRAAQSERRRMMNGVLPGEEIWQEYPPEFNNQLKEFVRDRDGRRCVLCGMHEDNHLGKLHVHHVTYDKSVIDPNLMVSLCVWCHNKTNINREFWQVVFTQYRHRQPIQDWQHRAVIM